MHPCIEELSELAAGAQEQNSSPMLPSVDPFRAA